MLAAQLAAAVGRLPDDDGRATLPRPDRHRYGRPTRDAPSRSSARRRGRARSGPVHAVVVGLPELVEERVHRGVLRFGRGRQDHRLGRLRPGGGPAGPPGLRGHHRPGQAPGRRPGSWTPWPTPPRQIEGPWPGELWALMLDPKGTFDDLVAPLRVLARAGRGHPGQPDLPQPHRGAVGNPGVHGHGEALRAGSDEGHFDLVVVDTPPTRNALDFLDAPRRLTRFLGHRLFQLLLMPTRAYLRAVSVATQALLRTISKVAGAEIVHDAVAFFQAFEGMEEGFRVRAERHASAAGPAHHRLRPRDLSPLRHRGGGGLVRRQAQRVRSWRWRAWSSTGSTPPSPSPSRSPTLRLEPPWPR